MVSGILFHGVIEAPCPGLSGENDLQPEHFLLPSLLLWNPWVTHPAFITPQTLNCPMCNCEMCQGGWNDGRTQSMELQPRTIQDVHQEVILVSAYYTCTHRHILLAHYEAVLQLILVQIRIPFTLFHKTGFTRNLASTTLCQRGMNFYTMKSLLHEHRWKTYTIKKEAFQHYHSLGHSTDTCTTFPEFQDLNSIKDAKQQYSYKVLPD